MTIESAFLVAFWGSVGTLFAIYGIHRLWAAGTAWAARRIEQLAAEALGEAAPRTNRYDRLDAEYRALVIAEHNKDD